MPRPQAATAPQLLGTIAAAIAAARHSGDDGTADMLAEFHRAASTCYRDGEITERMRWSPALSATATYAADLLAVLGHGQAPARPASSSGAGTRILSVVPDAAAEPPCLHAE